MCHLRCLRFVCGCTVCFQGVVWVTLYLLLLCWFGLLFAICLMSLVLCFNLVVVGWICTSLLLVDGCDSYYDLPSHT